MPQITAVRRLGTEAVSFKFDDGVTLFVAPRPATFGDYSLPLQVRLCRGSRKLGEINFGYDGQITHWQAPGKWSKGQTLAYYRQARNFAFSADTDHGVCPDSDLPHVRFVMGPYDPVE